MKKDKRYTEIIVLAAVVLIVVLALCVSRLTDKGEEPMQSVTSVSDTVSDTVQDSTLPETTQRKEEVTETKTPAEGLTLKNGEGKVTINMPYDQVKSVLDSEKISYRAKDMYIDTKGGTTYLFWTNGTEKRVNSVLFTATAEGLKIGDSADKVTEIYGSSTPVQISGKTYYCYIFGSVQLTVRVEEDTVKGISLGYVKLHAPSGSASQTSEGLFKGEYTAAAAGDNDHQRKVEYTAQKGTRECFVQIAESQVGYVNGYVNAGNVVFPYSHTDGWNKYGNKAGLPISAWCALFISWCADRAEIEESYMERSAIANINWQDYKSADSYTPKRGDLIYFKYNGFNNEMRVNHVGIVAQYDAETQTIITVEGNARGGQCVKRAYRLNDATSEITGFSAVRF